MFTDKRTAFEYAKQLRWPDGNVTCPRCGQTKHSFVNAKNKKGDPRFMWFCYVCKKQFTLKVGTIFEDSPIGLDKWLVAIWMLVNCKNGVSSYELHRTLGITQKSAWFVLHRIREAMRNKSIFKLGGSGGEIEADETYIGGKAINMHKSRKLKLQQIRGEERRGDGYLARLPCRASSTAICGRFAAR